MDVIARDSLEIASNKTAETARLPEGRQVVGPEWFHRMLQGIGGGELDVKLAEPKRGCSHSWWGMRDI